MKYFLIWLREDIKKDWLTNWPQRKKTMQIFGQTARSILQFGSWIVLAFGLFLAGMALVMTHGDVTQIAWGGVIELVFGVSLLNATFYISDKLEEYRKDKARFFNALRD